MVFHPFLPQPHSSRERIVVASPPRSLRKRIDQLCVATAENDIVGLAREAQLSAGLLDGVLPRVMAETRQACLAEPFHQRPARTVRQSAEVERDQDALRNQRRPESGAEAEEQHSASVVRTERLHRRVVEDADRTTERRAEVDCRPAGSKVGRVFSNA